MPILPTHHLKFPDGSSTYQIEEIREGHLRAEEEERDNHPTHQDPRPAEEAVVVEAVVAEEAGEEEEHSHPLDMHHPNTQKSFWGTHPPSSREIEPRSTHSLHNGNSTAA